MMSTAKHEQISQAETSHGDLVSRDAISKNSLALSIRAAAVASIRGASS